MSGIVGSKLNIRGSGRIAKLGTDGQVLTSAGAGTSAVYEDIGVVGKQTIWVPANAMTPTTSNGCAAIAAVETTSGRPDMYVLDFDKDSDEHAQFTVAFHKSWNLGTVTFQAFCSGIEATTGVSW